MKKMMKKKSLILKLNVEQSGYLYLAICTAIERKENLLEQYRQAYNVLSKIKMADKETRKWLKKTNKCTEKTVKHQLDMLNDMKNQLKRGGSDVQEKSIQFKRQDIDNRDRLLALADFEGTKH